MRLTCFSFNQNEYSSFDLRNALFYLVWIQPKCSLKCSFCDLVRNLYSAAAPRRADRPTRRVAGVGWGGGETVITPSLPLNLNFFHVWISVQGAMRNEARIKSVALRAQKAARRLHSTLWARLCLRRMPAAPLTTATEGALHVKQVILDCGTKANPTH